MVKLSFLACFVAANMGNVAASLPSRADDGEAWSFHGQATFVEQYHPAFASPYRGANSLDPGSRGNETFDLTFFMGARLWDGAEIYANPEIDQGFGLSDTVGIAGYSSGEAYKVGKADPYFRLQRLFLRQSFDLGGDAQPIEAGANQLAGERSADNLVITAGKFSATDIFDTNPYAHDPKGDFFNWSLIDAGAYDYAADAWGYSYGVTGEWTSGRWTFRSGAFNLSRVPNTTELERDFRQFELVDEVERRYEVLGRAGTLKLLAFLNRGDFGGYSDAVRLAQATDTTPQTSLVRHYVSRPGFSMNLAQEINDTLGGFLRASFNDGSKEADDFTEINRSLSAGLSLHGASWGRSDDVWGLGGAINDISAAARRYFASGGLGILIGDGRLPHYDSETIAETYYTFVVTNRASIALDYQVVLNPAYNPDRGPVSIMGLRVHAQF